MGFKQVELVPINGGPTPITPAGKTEHIKIFQMSRTDTSSTLKAVLPAQASLLSVYAYAATASDAGTTAVFTATMVDNSGTISTGSWDAKTNTSGIFGMTNIPNIEILPNQGDRKINVIYAETGTPSTTGGPWKVLVRYVL